MPPRSLKPCCHPGCKELVRGVPRCSKHQQQYDSARAFRCLKPESERPSFHARGYDRRWRAAREQWIRERPLCGDRLESKSAEHSECRRLGMNRVGNEVDHIKRHAGDRELFWDPRNWQTLCSACHHRKTSREMNEIRHANAASRAA